MIYPNDFIDKIICGESSCVMKDIPDAVIDLTVTSPPYGNLRDYKSYTFNFKDIANELYRITKPGGVIVWVVGDQVIDGSESGESFKQALYFKDIGFNLYDTMIYEKDGTRFPGETRYSQIFEYMFVLSKGKPKTVNLIKDHKNKYCTGRMKKHTTRQKDGSLVRDDFINDNEYSVRSNIWRISCGYQKTTHDTYAYEHPAMFPEKLVEDHVYSWSNINDLVLDCFVGSGTVAKVSKEMNRHFIGIDISEEYCRIANKRISIIQQDLFYHNDNASNGMGATGSTGH